jgi:Tol biopolymer transport system component
VCNATTRVGAGTSGPTKGPERLSEKAVCGTAPRTTFVCVGFARRASALSAASFGLVLLLSAFGASGARAPAGRIVFSKSSGGGVAGDIYVVTANGSSLRQLTHASTDQEPTWSPDGKSIVYVHLPTPAEKLPYRSALYQMQANGTRPHLLVPESASAGASISDPAWSPDGSKIAFDSQRSGELAIWTYTPSNGTSTQLTTGFASRPSWSPTGQQLAYTGTNGTIFVGNADGTSGLPISPPQVDDEDPIWSPNGKWIAVRNLNPDWRTHEIDSLVIMRPDGTGSRVVVSGGVIFPSAWSPTSDAILFFRKASSPPTATSQLYIVSITGGKPTRVPGTAGAVGFASWHR